MKHTFITIMAAAAVLAGCNRSEVEGAKGKGTFMLQSLTAETALNDVQVGTGTKSLPSEINADKLLATMALTITNSEDPNLRQTYKYMDIVNKPVELSTGSYSVSAVSTDAKDAAWDQPLFAGSTEFAVKVNAVSPVSLTCSMTNAVVSVKCSDTFNTEVGDYNIKVSDANGNFLTWTKGNVDADGYFTAKELTVTIEGKRTIDNSTATVSGTVKDIRAKDHIILNVDAKVTGEVQNITLTIDGSVKDRNEDIFVDGFEEIEIPDPSQPDTPDPDEPVKVDAPSLEWPDNPTFETMELAEKMKIDLLVKAPGKIKTFLVVVDSPALETLLPSMTGIEGKAGCTLDLINNKTLIDNFADMDGMTLPTGDELKGKTEVEFPLSSLVPMIYRLEVNNKEQASSDHKFTLEVSDELGQTYSKTLVFHYTAQVKK